MSTVAVAGFVRRDPRLLIVDYDLLGPDGKQVGGGFTRLEASNLDSVCKQLNAMLRGHRYKIKQVTPIT